jgi:hypothetical protein
MQVPQDRKEVLSYYDVITIFIGIPVDTLKENTFQLEISSLAYHQPERARRVGRPTENIDNSIVNTLSKATHWFTVLVARAQNLVRVNSSTLSISSWELM